MAASEIHVGDIGTQLRVTVREGGDNSIVDLSDADVLKINLKKPDGNILENNASLFTDGTDGIMQYVTVSGTWDGPGTWRIQGYIETDGAQFSTNFKSFTVHRNL